MPTLLSPVGAQELERFRPAPRTRDLNGKRVALVWNGKQNGEVVLQCLEARLRARYPQASTAHVRIGYGIPKDQLDDLAARFDAAVASTGD